MGQRLGTGLDDETWNERKQEFEQRIRRVFRHEHDGRSANCKKEVSSRSCTHNGMNNFSFFQDCLIHKWYWTLLYRLHAWMWASFRACQVMSELFGQRLQSLIAVLTGPSLEHGPKTECAQSLKNNIGPRKSENDRERRKATTLFELFYSQLLYKLK